MSYIESIKTDMYSAMKSGDKEKAGTLRTLLAKLKDRQINTRKELTDKIEQKDNKIASLSKEKVMWPKKSKALQDIRKTIMKQFNFYADHVGYDVNGEILIPAIKNRMEYMINKKFNRLSDLHPDTIKSLHNRIKKSFINSTKRVWVHTCSLDHKHALKNYLSRGMKIFKSEVININ